MSIQENDCANGDFSKADRVDHRRHLIFFTGGTALRELSCELARHTPNTVHLVTTFDSGGSSAALRRAFAMPAVGDLRNRLLALADPSIPQGVLDFCSARLPEQGLEGSLRQKLQTFRYSDHPAWQVMPLIFAEPLRRFMTYFLERMPEDFDPRGASLGNLMLAGGYLWHKRDFSPVLALFSRLLRLRGVVEPIVNESLHLAAELDDGSFVSGQHYFRNLARSIRRVFLSVHEPDRFSCSISAVSRTENSSESRHPLPCRPPLAAQAGAWLSSPGAIVYPMGSFYSSLIATLLPHGVGSAIVRASCPKIFIPNSGHDPELHGMSIVEQCCALVGHLREDSPNSAPEDFLRYVLIDGRHGYYNDFNDKTREKLAAMNLELVDADIVCPDNAQRHDPERAARALLQLLALPAEQKYANQTRC